jgi:hypothetical protein
MSSHLVVRTDRDNVSYVYVFVLSFHSYIK